VGEERGRRLSGVPLVLAGVERLRAQFKENSQWERGLVAGYILEKRKAALTKTGLLGGQVIPSQGTASISTTPLLGRLGFFGQTTNNPNPKAQPPVKVPAWHCECGWQGLSEQELQNHKKEKHPSPIRSYG